MDAQFPDGLALPRVAARWWRGRRHAPHVAERVPADSGALVVQIETARAADPAFRSQWLALVEGGASPQKIYQLPQFFDAVRDSDDGSAPIELLTVRRRLDHALLAVVPVRPGPHALAFNIGKLVLCRRSIAAVQLLGSVPASAGQAISPQFLARRCLELFPQCQALVLAALPAGPLWTALSCGPGQGLHASLLSDWRACHIMPLPRTVDAYMQQFSAKKRYNLRRQLRLLAGHYGELAVLRVEHPGQVGALFDAISSLLPLAKMAKVQRRESLEALASHGLLLCYVVTAGAAPLGVVTATRSAHVLHIHNIYADDSQRSLSVGTSVMQLALEDIIRMSCFRLIDFGYGTPRHDYSSSQVLEARAPVAIVRDAGRVGRLLAAHRAFHLLADRLVRLAKALRRTWRA